MLMMFFSVVIGVVIAKRRAIQSSLAGNGVTGLARAAPIIYAV
jgi:hypothetical protein